MRAFITALLSLALFVPSSAATRLSDAEFVAVAQNATVLLYAQDSNGTLNMLCTATAFSKTKRAGQNVFSFVSAAHCVGNDDTTKEHSASADNIPFFVTFDERAVDMAGRHIPKAFYVATVTLVGYQHRGEDFSVFEVVTDQDWPTIPLGNENKEVVPAPFWNIASPLGLGKQVMEGSISNLDLDRPIIFKDINWMHSLVLQMSGVNGGSSGSALIAKDQRAIVGFLVGSIDNSTITAIPVSRLSIVLAAQARGKYPWYSPKVEIDLSDGK